MPLIFSAILFACRRKILNGQSTRLVRSTMVLHGEYKPRFFWWEGFSMMQRVIVNGFVQWITHATLRLSLGIIVCLAYLVVLLLLQPFKRTDVGYVAYGSQGAILVGYLMVMCIHLFSALEEEENSELSSKILGFDSLDSLVAATVVTMIAFFSWFVVFVAYQAMINSDLQLLQLKESRRPPDLSLRKHIFYHLFLSHIWSSGQDQVAVIKRKLQLLLPQCRIFWTLTTLTTSITSSGT
mmetsp:Transcript_3860/g.10067  ORF Transcript_3860/g.10067 Transcript_3860/m.10067 type:complete len:239 (-) Transcript_3860:1605-2321(-)